MEEEISQEVLTRIFRFDLSEGRLFWREPPKNHPRLMGKEAGGPRLSHSGKLYWKVKIAGKHISRARIIFRAVYGFWPRPCVDHKDGNSLNDRPQNLRQATVLQNNWNHQKRGKASNLPMGVRLLPSGKFQARLGYRGRQINIGIFTTAEEAHLAHRREREARYGRFA